MTGTATAAKDGFVTLRISDELRVALEELARRNERSRSAEIRVALAAYVKAAA
jgi:predicted transcriptional regulator